MWTLRNRSFLIQIEMWGQQIIKMQAQMRYKTPVENNKCKMILYGGGCKPMLWQTTISVII